MVARAKERQSQSKSSSPKGGGILANLHRKITSFIGRPIVASDVYWGILLCNILVFLGNRSPLGPFFLRRFINSPYGPTPALSMLLSVFSHHSLFHLFINMYVLHSFSSGLINNIGAGDFLSLFIGGGVFASFISLLSKAARRSPVPSLGASGGICAILGAFCMLQPHARLCIPFVVDLFPHSFEAGHSVWVLLTFEFCASVIFVSRSPIDHAAHMGGLIFGMYYGLSGNEAIWRRRTAIVSWWRQLRGE
ncbi:Presenilin associated rhomboid [Fasciola gigantica]|uniref:rhomboid protease n=1 Tax=Fasciola gigantica TaxID=46835 RepID=A0A504YJ94_FASGI|nr:Presenilin associated rhomboid [Fasciola gigantica]